MKKKVILLSLLSCILLVGCVPLQDMTLQEVIDNGNIVEQGNHEQLMAKQGVYAELYNSQFEM